MNSESSQNKGVFTLNFMDSDAEKLRTQLPENGYQVSNFRNIDEIREATATLPPKFIILREKKVVYVPTDEFPNQHILVVGHDTTPTSATRYLNAGATRYITPPVTIPLILATMRSIERQEERLYPKPKNQRIHVAENIEYDPNQFKLFRDGKSIPNINSVTDFIGFLAQKKEASYDEIVEWMEAHGNEASIENAKVLITNARKFLDADHKRGVSHIEKVKGGNFVLHPYLNGSEKD